MGQGLSYPLVTQHIERRSNPFCRVATVHVNGLRPSQEDDHNTEFNINNKNLMVFSVMDGHAGQDAAILCAQELPKSVYSKLDLIEEDGEQVYFFDAREETYTPFINQLLNDFDEYLCRQTPSGCTACIVLAQPWDLTTNKAITTPFDESFNCFNRENKDKYGIKLMILNIGDSRAIILRAPNTTSDDTSPPFVLEACTKDHKPSNPEERARIEKHGGFVEADRVDGNLALSRAFGDVQYKTNRSSPHHDQKVIAVPTITTFDVKYNDLLLVACDGIYEAEAMSREVVASLVHDAMDDWKQYYTQHLNIDPTSELADLLFDPADVARDIIAESICLGSRDNHTAIVVSFTSILGVPKASDNTVIQHMLQKPRFEIVPGPCLNSIEQPFHSDLADSHLFKCLATDDERDALIPTRQQIDTVSRFYGDLEAVYSTKLQDDTTGSVADDMILRDSRYSRVVTKEKYKSLLDNTHVNPNLPLHCEYKSSEIHASPKEMIQALEEINANFNPSTVFHTCPLFLHSIKKTNGSTGANQMQFSAEFLQILMSSMHGKGGLDDDDDDDDDDDHGDDDGYDHDGSDDYARA